MPRLRTAALPELHPLVLVPLLLSAWVYYPITRTFFFADDFVHLADIESETAVVFLLRPFGGNAFLARNLVFLGSYHLFGLDPVAFQWTALLTHLLNVALMFGLLRAMTASAWLACLGAAAWGMSPLSVDSLNWYAAFGHVLVGTTLLLVLRSVVRVAAEGGPIPARTAATWFVLLIVGSTCYGPGMGVALVFPVALVLLLPAAWWQQGVRLAFLALPVATLALYYGLRYLYTVVGELSMEEVFHQKVALSGFQEIPAMWAHLLGYSAGGTVLGFFLPKAYPHPLVWGAVASLAGGLALLLWRGSARTRRLALAMLVLWGGVYLMIAGGRAHMYALFNVPAAAAAMIGRYHYAGTIPIAVTACLVLREIGRLPGLRAVPRGFAAAIGLAILVHGHRHATFTVDNRPLAHDYFLDTRKDLVGTIARAPQGATLYLENQKTPVYVLGPAIPNRLFPGHAAVFLLTPSMPLDGREVRFIERDPSVLAWYRERPDTPLARLLVAPEEIPGSP